ncbi:MAG: DNA-3-methyladenine glycosylase [Clostridia bacterium]|nr:DNA-3-methyladenine glycosylase [Clostridia bacterium]
MMHAPLPRSFYTVDGCTLAERCLGKLLVLETAEGRMTGLITETEAYMGITDRASHAYGGRRTARNETMYRCGGYAYVYQIYGLYHCLNITAAEEGNPEAVLIRGILPVDGIELLCRNRQKNGRAASYPDAGSLTQKQLRTMTDGPGKLCTAFGIGREMDGADLTSGRLYLADTRVQAADIRRLPRIGIDYAGEDRSKPWRFLASLSPTAEL